MEKLIKAFQTQQTNPGVAVNFALFILLALLVLTSSSQAMTSSEALRLTKAWSKSSGESTALANLKIPLNGNFNIDIRGAHFDYHSQDRKLMVSGLVGQDMLQLKIKAAWQKIQTAEKREEVTLGDGHFELVQIKTMNAEPPVLLLTKAFVDGSIRDDQFLLEVRWLLEWATHWRKTRMTELFSGSSSEVLDQQGLKYVAWAKQKRPRPW